MTKEEAYDEKIFPLMDQVIAICKEHKIALLANFTLEPASDEIDGLAVTTALLNDEYGPSEGQLRALEFLKPQHPVALAETIETRPDGSKNITITRIS